MLKNILLNDIILIYSYFFSFYIYIYVLLLLLIYSCFSFTEKDKNMGIETNKLNVSSFLEVGGGVMELEREEAIVEEEEGGSLEARQRRRKTDNYGAPPQTAESSGDEAEEKCLSDNADRGLLLCISLLFVRAWRSTRKACRVT